MKTSFNLSTYPDEIAAYTSSEDLRTFYEQFGCAGVEVLPFELKPCEKVTEDMILGVHCRCVNEWMDHDYPEMIEHYRQDLDYAESVHAKYVVFHVTQITCLEFMTHQTFHTDEEVIDGASCLINDLLDGQHYSFYFLMENLWHPGLTFLRKDMTKRLLSRVHYPKKGFMFDTGHYMNTNTALRTPNDALSYLHEMVDQNEEFLPWIKGLHLHQSLSGEFVQDFIANPPVVETDPDKLAAQCFPYVFKTDQHRPFSVDGVKEFVERIDPEFVTYEYVTRSREELASFLEEGSRPFR